MCLVWFAEVVLFGLKQQLAEPAGQAQAGNQVGLAIDCGYPLGLACRFRTCADIWRACIWLPLPPACCRPCRA